MPNEMSRVGEEGVLYYIVKSARTTWGFRSPYVVLGISVGARNLGWISRDYAQFSGSDVRPRTQSAPYGNMTEKKLVLSAEILRVESRDFMMARLPT
ncbi:hypothetical protein DL771_010204 [Monosporascus sp. 5C6A]|nr:hypothetical protein DL771_010204 [Monosporascus sp. 5C6A]